MQVINFQQKVFKKLDNTMELPNEHILDVFFPQTAELHGEPAAVNRNEILPRVLVPDIDIMQQMALAHEVRPHSSLIGAGDGPQNNQIQWDENLPPLIIVRGRQPSKFWRFVPLMILMSSCFFKCFLSCLGIDIQSAGILGLSYNLHFSILQWLILIASYWFKGFSEQSVFQIWALPITLKLPVLAVNVLSDIFLKAQVVAKQKCMYISRWYRLHCF